MSKVEMGTLKVWKQTANKDNEGKTKSVTLQCSRSGRKKDDGSYEKPMYVNVFVGSDCEWTPDDYTGKFVDVDGSLSHSEWNKDGKSGLNFTIFANSLKEHIWENK